MSLPSAFRHQVRERATPWVSAEGVDVLWAKDGVDNLMRDLIRGSSARFLPFVQSSGRVGQLVSLGGDRRALACLFFDRDRFIDESVRAEPKAVQVHHYNARVTALFDALKAIDAIDPFYVFTHAWGGAKWHPRDGEGMYIHTGTTADWLLANGCFKVLSLYVEYTASKGQVVTLGPGAGYTVSTLDNCWPCDYAETCALLRDLSPQLSTAGILGDLHLGAIGSWALAQVLQRTNPEMLDAWVGDWSSYDVERTRRLVGCAFWNSVLEFDGRTCRARRLATQSFRMLCMQRALDDMAVPGCTHFQRLPIQLVQEIAPCLDRQ